MIDRAKAAAWGVLVAGAVAASLVLARTDWAGALATSPLELIPAGDKSRELAAVRQLAGDAQGRSMLALVESPAGRAAEAAGALGAALMTDPGTPGMIAVNPHDMGSRREAGRALFDNRFALLFPKWLERSRAELKAAGRTESPEALAAYATARLEGFLKTDASFAFEKLIPKDALMMMPDATLPLMKEAGAPPRPERAMLWVDTGRPPLAKAGQQPVFDAWRRAEAAARAVVPDVTVRTTGVNAFAAASEAGIKGELSLLNGVALAGVALVCMAALRSVMILPHIALITALAMAGSWAVTLLAFGRIHVFAVALGALLSGLVVDFTLYVMLHEGGDGRPAGFDRLRPMLRPLFGGGLVAAAGFAFLTLSPLPAIRQTGVFTAVGIVAALVFAVAWGSVVRFRHAGGGRRLPSDTWRTRFRRPPLWALIPLIAGVPFIRWNDSLKDLEYPLPALRANDREIRAAFGDTGRRLWLVSGDTCGDALGKMQAFAATVATATGGKHTVRGPLTMLATPGEHARAEAFLRQDGAAFESAFRASLTRAGYDVADFGEFFGAFAAAKAGLPAHEVAAEAFLGALTGPESMLVSRHGDLRLMVCWTDADAPIADPAVAAGVFPLNRLESLNATLGRYRDNMLKLTGLGFVATVLINLAVLRRASAVRDFALPTAVAMALAGAAGWCGMRLTLFHLAGAFLGLCCSLNYPVFAREAREAGKPFPLAVTLAWATSALSFGALCFSGIPAVFALGSTVTALVTTTYLAVRYDRR